VSVDVRATKTLEHVPSFSSLLLREKTDARAHIVVVVEEEEDTRARERRRAGGRVRVRGERERERARNRERSLVIHLERELYPSKNPTKQWRQRS
jgi:hypothetical protein